MRRRFLGFIGVLTVMYVVSVFLAPETVRVAGQTQTASGQARENPVVHTVWGEPDLQGIWTVELLVPLQRPAGVTTEFYTEEQVAEIDGRRVGTSVFGNHARDVRGTEGDVSGAYNAVYTSQRPTSRRTAMITDPTFHQNSLRSRSSRSGGLLMRDPSGGVFC